ncbi:MAG: hypothetical protein NTV05_00965, partial [Acidobacteria bacterium]|nr:hypothetical protein [Acidobacteriota bacterium]
STRFVPIPSAPQVDVSLLATSPPPHAPVVCADRPLRPRQHLGSETADLVVRPLPVQGSE